ncbi:MAG: glycine cleavage system protein H [Acidobacteriia bacterium]|nr:glycine cleavage system protein H [Terriglobia bacterium]
MRDLGLNYPADRFYHRGHTWVRLEADGTLTIGLDELAEHLIGSPDFIKVPGVGSEIENNETAWRIEKNGTVIRVRAPIEGTVVGVGGPLEGRYLKIRPRRNPQDPATLRHLLRGAEVHGWLSRELERLQLQLRAPNTPPSLADGGVLVSGLMDAVPDADWNTVLADTFLEG